MEWQTTGRNVRPPASNENPDLRPLSSSDICLARCTKSLQAVYAAATKAGRLLPLHVLTFIPLRAGVSKFTVFTDSRRKMRKFIGTEKIFCVLDQQEKFLKINFFKKGKSTVIWISEAALWS